MAAGNKTIIILRFSALGDIAMTVPVIRLLLQQHPDIKVVMISQPFVAPLFAGIERLTFFGADTKTTYKGFRGLRKLAKVLNTTYNAGFCADMHNVLRTKILRFFLRGKKAVIDKGRSDKRKLTRSKNKILKPLKPGFQRYADVLKTLGFSVDINAAYTPLPPRSNIVDDIAASYTSIIGIAPFARHQPKMYPPELMEQVVQMLSELPGTLVVLLGSKAEAGLLQNWEQKYSHVKNIAGKYSFRDELAIIASLSAMLSMDSANMHLAALYSVPVISVWGGTHPYAGFYGWRQPEKNAVQLDLPCRPSSVFGNKPCPVHGLQGCMEGITPKMIFEKVQGVLSGGFVNK